MLRTIHSPDRGTTLVEYGAVIILVAAIISALISAGITTTTSTSLASAVDRILGLEPKDAPDTDGSGDGGTQSAADKPGEPGEQGGSGGSGDSGSSSKSDPDPDPDMGLLPGALADLGGAGSYFHVGGAALKKVDWAGKWNNLKNHKVYVPTTDLNLSEWINPGGYLARKSVEWKTGVETERPEGVAGQIFGFDREFGGIVGGGLSGAANIALHPIDSAKGGWNSFLDSGAEQFAGYGKIARDFRKDVKAGDFDSYYWAPVKLARYHFLDSPFSAGKMLVNDDARTHFSKGEYGEGSAQVLASLAELVPGAKAAGIAGRLGGKARPKAPGGDHSVLAGGERKPSGSSKGSDPDKSKDPDRKDEPEGASCPRPNSFVPGTPVLMADGSSTPIESVEVGDEVAAFDPRTGEEGPRPVTHLIEGEGQKTLVTITVTDQNGETGVVTATANHPFWAPEPAKWIKAATLKPGTWLRTKQGPWTQVTALQSHTTHQKVHNLTIADLHTYHVLAGQSPVLVHNSGDCAEDSYSIEDHVIPRHTRGGAEADATKSLFDDGVDLGNLATGSAGQVGRYQPATGNIRYFITSKNIVGVDRRGLPTKTYTIVRDGRDGELITMHPGLPRDLDPDD